jgi:hypothetical protein
MGLQAWLSLSGTKVVKLEGILLGMTMTEHLRPLLAEYVGNSADKVEGWRSLNVLVSWGICRSYGAEDGALA